MEEKKVFLIFVLSTLFGKRAAQDVRTACFGKYELFWNDPNEPDLGIKEKFYSFLQTENFLTQPQLVFLEHSDETISIIFDYADDKEIPIIWNGPLEGKGKYRLSHAYFNWLQATPDHWTYNGEYFRAELHLAFYSIKYGEFEEARKQNEGIAIMTCVFWVRPEVNQHEIELIANGLKNIKQAYEQTSIDPFSLYGIFPFNISQYYTYIGSMISSKRGTCQPDVIWLDFDEHLDITPILAEEFFALRTSYEVPLTSVTSVRKAKVTKQIYKSTSNLGHREEAKIFIWISSSVIFMLFTRNI